MSALRFERLWWAGGFVLIGVVVVGCLLPAPVIAPVSRLMPDKFEHALAYFGLTLWFSALVTRRNWWKVALAFAALGGCIEIAQGLFTTTREADIKDEMANCTGIIVGWAVAATGGWRWARVAEWVLGVRRA